jgi:hypothetical protein
MPNDSQIWIPMQEVAKALVRERGIHEGHWGIAVTFGIGAVNIAVAEQDLRPAAIIPIVQMGIQRFNAPNNLTVDAAEVNPSQPGPRRTPPPKAPPPKRGGSRHSPEASKRNRTG